MAEVTTGKATVASGGEDSRIDPERVVKRLERLRQSRETATGERAESLDKEIEVQKAKLATLREALARAESGGE